MNNLADYLEGVRTVAIAGHVNPDGDCIGSQLALMHALRSLGKRAVCLLAKDEPIDARLAFLPGADELVPAALYDGPAGGLLASGRVETAFGVRPRPGGVRFERA